METFELVKKFLEEKPACSEALKYLKNGVEISVNIENNTPCSLFMDNGQARFERRAARNPDIEFVLFPEAIRRLADHPGDQMAPLGIEIIREIAIGQIKISVVSGVSQVLSRGYLKIIKAAGPDFAKVLTYHGLNSLTQIISFVKQLKRRR